MFRRRKMFQAIIIYLSLIVLIKKKGKTLLRNLMNKVRPGQTNLIRFDSFDETLISRKCMETRKGQFLFIFEYSLIAYYHLVE